METVWKDILKGVNYREWLEGQERDLEIVEETNGDQNENDDLDIEKEYPNCDGLVLSILPDDIIDEDIKKMLESKVLNSSDGISTSSRSNEEQAG